MMRRSNRVQLVLEGLEERKVLSNNGFGQAVAAEVHTLVAPNPAGNETFGQYVSSFAQGNGLQDFNSSNPADPGTSKVQWGTLPPGQSK